MEGKGLISRAGVAAIAALGIALAHWAAYAVVVPDPHAREGLLETTGHTYLPLLGAALVAVLVGTVGVSLVERFGRGTRIPTDLLVIAFIQVGGFAVLEVGERALFGSSGVAGIAGEPVVWLGLMFQVVVAAAATLVLRLLIKGAAIVRALFSGAAPARRRTPSVVSFFSQIAAPRPAPCAGASSRRGPPLLVSF